ncbi:unnamed protein product [Effrenium voratum]|uniref:Uncharacterized protein n=1 Tax=Effrenium voratum TaxID=2562239 RepID=A0AA36IA02_9DINO|nr:unnamed protein product [Effrenium voratum]
MASVPPHRAESLARSFDNANLDGNCTLEEAIAHTDGMKILYLEKPMVVNKEPGSIKLGDLPAKMEITDSVKKKTQFLDVIADHEGPIDLNAVETMFLQQRYADLPEPVRMKGNFQAPYNMQIFIIPKEGGKKDIIKRIKFLEGAKVLHSSIISMCQGVPLEIDLQGKYRDGGRGPQYMLEGLGGFQVRYQKLVSAGASSKMPKETEEIHKGFAYIRQFGPEENSDGQFTVWTEEQVNDPNGPLHKWDKGTIKEFLRCLADQGSQANTIKEWPLTFKSITPWALNTILAPILPHVMSHSVIWIGKSQVGKSPVSYTLSSVVSAYWLIQEEKEGSPCFQTCNHLDYFRKEKGRRTKPRVFDDGNLNLEHPAGVKAVTEVDGVDRKTMARYNASSYAKNQLCQICSNPYDRTAEPPMDANSTQDTVTFEQFYKIVRPSFHRDFDEEDLVGVFKRSTFIVFTDVGMYVRVPGTDRKPVPRYAWPERDIGMISPSARPLLAAYKRGNLSHLPADHDKDMQWSLNLLQAALDGEEVRYCATTRGKELFSGREYVIEDRPTLAGIEGKTKYYLDAGAAVDEPPTKKLRSVKSSSNLLKEIKNENAQDAKDEPKDEDEQKTKEEQKENEDAQDAKDEPKDEDEQKTKEEEKDEDVQGIKEEPEETHKVHIKQEPVDPSYFSKPLNLRPLVINLSDTSEDASDPASAAPAAADAVDPVEKLSDPTAPPAADVVDETKVLVPLPASSPDVVDPMDEIPDQYDIEAYRTLSQELADAMDIDDN